MAFAATLAPVQNCFRRYGPMLAFVALLGAIPGSASGQGDPPLCGDEFEGLTTYAPRAVEAGKLFAVESEHDGFTAVERTEVGFAGGVYPFHQDEGDTTRVLVPAPTTLGLGTLTVSWYQPEEGTPCKGEDRHAVRTVPAGSRIGDTEVGRIAGRWAMKFDPVDFDAPIARRRWSWRPVCDYGACDASARSNTGNRFRFRLGSDGVLRAKGSSGRGGACTVTRTLGDTVLSRRVISPAWKYTWIDELRVTRTRERVGLLEATRLRGINRLYTRPLPAARRAGCRGNEARERLTGRRL